jgi:hypothetical protein
MSTCIGVFVKTTEELEPFANAVGLLLGITFESGLNGYDEPCYVSRDGRRTVRIDRHQLEDDRDMSFERYQYEIEVQAYRVADDYESVQEQYARSIYEKLRETKKYPLMLVFDVQRKLAEYDPASEAS